MRRQRPALEVRAAYGGVEHDPASGGVQAHPELDVLDRRPRVALGVEAADRVEGVAADRAEAGPERRRRAGAALTWTWWCRRLRKRDTTLAAAGRSS